MSDQQQSEVEKNEKTTEASYYRKQKRRTALACKSKRYRTWRAQPKKRSPNRPNGRANSSISSIRTGTHASRRRGRSLTVVEAQVVAQLSSDNPLLHKRLHTVWKPPRRLHSHHRGLCAYLPHVEVRRHVRANVLVRVVGKVRKSFQTFVDEGLEVVASRLRSGNEPGYLCQRRREEG